MRTAPSTLGSFLRSFTFGHVRQLDAVVSRFLTGLGDQAPLVDIDDTIVEVHGHAKQGSGYTAAIFDQITNTWISRAEINYTAFTSKKKTDQIPGRLVVRRIPDLNPKAATGQATLFDTWRFHAFFTTSNQDTTNTVTADQTHRGHAIVEQVNADLKNSALAHLPSGHFWANAAWLVLAVIAFNLTRAAAPSLSG